MLSENEGFGKDKIEFFLKELAKQYKKDNGKYMDAEIILIGGASIALNYNFRQCTFDIDAIIRASSAMKDSINKVGDKYNLSNGWLNQDFIATNSYSKELVAVSQYYRKYSGILEIRTVSAEYLVATKLMSCRLFKHDLSDIIGIMYEQKCNGKEITLDKLKKATKELYGSWQALPDFSKEFAEKVCSVDNLLDYMTIVRNEEEENYHILKEFDKMYSNILNDDNTSNILIQLKGNNKLLDFDNDNCFENSLSDNSDTPDFTQRSGQGHGR